MSARDGLAKLIAAGYGSDESPCPYDHAPAIADAVLAAGYSRPNVLGYVVVDRDGKVMRDFDDRPTAEKFAAEYTKDCTDSGIDWDYRVATIIEVTA